MNVTPTQLTLATIYALLITTSTGDLSGIDGAFGISSAEWSVVCFVCGIVVAMVGCVIGGRSKPDA